MIIKQTGRRRILPRRFTAVPSALGRQPLASCLLLAVSVISWATPAANSAPLQTTPSPSASAEPDAIGDANRAFIATVLKEISGRETQPAESVFKNVKWLGKVEAGTFLSIMNIGYAQALGVRCTYCHVETDFASDSKRPKRADRETQVTHRMINTELRKMEHIPTPASENRAIICKTCHRGAASPLR